MTPRPDPERFTRLQARAQAAAETVRAYRIQMSVKYGQACWMSRGERTRVDALQGRSDRAARVFFEYVQAISPRDWSAGVPFHWIISSLTYADAVARGELATVPPAAYGYQTADLQRFSRPV